MQHYLRTPVSGVAVMLELFSNKEQDSEKKNHVGVQFYARIPASLPLN